MATADISLRGRRKTMLIYRAGDGLALRQVDTRSDQAREIPLTAEDIDMIVQRWPDFREALLNAGVPNV